MPNWWTVVGAFSFGMVFGLALINPTAQNMLGSWLVGGLFAFGIVAKLADKKE